MIGGEIYKWIEDLFPINRSITGHGVVETLEYIKRIIPNLKIKYFNSGDKVFDWTVPNEWQINNAYIEDDSGNKIIDFKKNNLHVMSYSSPIDKVVDFNELMPHLYSRPDLPDAIPYHTTYYKKNWGFCISENQRKLFHKNKNYRVVIDAKLFPGKMHYGELFIKGNSKKEIFFSTYICHPSMANNELSGPAVLVAISRFLNSVKFINYSYRIIFVPETIGSIAYLSKNFTNLKRSVNAGFVINCVGDRGSFSYMPSRTGNTYADKVALNVLASLKTEFKSYNFLERGSDERQYCSPLIDLPVCSIMKSKYMEYKEYHTSLDNLNFISKDSLESSYKLYRKIILILEADFKKVKTNVYCEPMLEKYNLYYGGGGSIEKNLKTQDILNLVAYSDGKNDIFDLSKKTNISLDDLIEYIDLLIEKKIIKNV